MQHPPYTPDWATPCRESLPVTERAVLDLMSYVPWQVLAALLVIGLVTIATGIGLFTIWCGKTLRDAWNKYHRVRGEGPLTLLNHRDVRPKFLARLPSRKGQDLPLPSKNLPLLVATLLPALSAY